MIIDSYRSIGETPWVKVTIREIIEDMDDAGVDLSVVAPMGRLMAVDYVEGNRLMIDIQKRYPDRIIGFATVNPWSGSEIVREEIKRAISAGLRGIAINPAVQGVAAHSPLMYPVVEAAIELDVPLYIHSGTPSFGLPLQITFLAEAYPEAKIIMGHMGGADFYVDMQSSNANIPNLYLETSLTCHVAYIEQGLRIANKDHMLFGSDFPFSSTKAEMLKINQAYISDAEKAKIFGANAAVLFGIEGAVQHDS